MAKTKSGNKTKISTMPRTDQESAEQLYASALTLVEQSQPEEALQRATELWRIVQAQSTAQKLPALNLLGEICVELGDVEQARIYFEQAVLLDPHGAVPETNGGGAEKFLWLAQLCDEGGKVSVQWFEKGANALQQEIAALESNKSSLDEDTILLMRMEKKRKLANALCGIIEVYMTDLSWEDEAEARCESLITQAMAVEDETSPEVLQTLASIRLSQQRVDDAKAALSRSISIWEDLDPEDAAVPDFATRISLARLLMEAEMEREAASVLERLILEDDSSVEAWYLGGWCRYLIAERLKTQKSPDAAETTPSNVEIAQKGSRHWLKQALKLYALLEYEDDRLLVHAQELVAELDAILGPEDETEDGDDDVWDGIDDDAEDDQDEEMKDS